MDPPAENPSGGGSALSGATFTRAALFGECAKSPSVGAVTPPKVATDCL